MDTPSPSEQARNLVLREARGQEALRAVCILRVGFRLNGGEGLSEGCCLILCSAHVPGKSIPLSVSEPLAPLLAGTSVPKVKAAKG